MAYIELDRPLVPWQKQFDLEILFSSKDGTENIIEQKYLRKIKDLLETFETNNKFDQIFKASD